MPRRAAEAAMKAQLAAIETARDAGRDYYIAGPGMMLVEVSRWASQQYTDVNQQIGFLQGYCDARQRHDAYKQERT